MSTVRSADHTTIAYETAGSGPGVVLVDGATCFRDSGPMRAISELLAPSATVVMYDRRGRGESGDTPPYALEREIEDIAALIDAVGAPVSLFGMSSGGALALESAVALGPERVNRLAVYEPPFVPEEALPSAAAYTRELSEALAADDRDRAVELFLKRVGVPVTAIDTMRRSPGWASLVGIAPTLAYDDAALGDSAVPIELAGAVRVPLLALGGGASPAFLRYGAEALAAAVPDGDCAILEGQTHDVSADAIAPVLARFAMA
ncbi:alpha/beta fold hydrolase [Leifsonia sp. McL0607]|uniref:alpha/beta fold hydrolase n=1 Tax=Leifsonia sp. McL0607 TaxID=3415672 RepID=UPI003CE95BB7